MSKTNIQIEAASGAGKGGKAILRAPPFPDARPRGHPIQRAPGPIASRSLQEVAAICGAIVEARIGGAFWQAPPATPPFDTLVRPRSRRDVATRIAADHREDAGAPLVWHPTAADGANDARQLAGDQDAWALLPRAKRVFAAADDEVGLLAAARGQAVHDLVSGAAVDPDQAREHLVRTLDAFAYFDPFDGAPIALAEWIAILARWRAEIDDNRRIATIAGIRRWKRGVVRRLLWSDQPAKPIASVDLAATPTGKAVAIWPARAPRGIVQQAARNGIPIARIEDGFIRSVGLGAHLVPPCSIVLDRAGIYYDPAQPSDLERILSDTIFSAPLLRRAEALIDALVTGGVTKYAVGPGARVALPPAFRRILVPGQVEDDQSVRLGACGVTGNLDLLRRVRRAEPDAWIAYRPHPDVAAGLRKGHVAEKEALRHADMVIAAGSMSDLLDQVDSVHVLTSLAGFEALLRGREVVTHGQPFYAGWGLTRDLAPPVARRRRRLTLLELVAGTLILYPRYLDPETCLPCPPEILVRRHAAAAQPQPTALNRLRRAQGKARLLGRRLVGAGG